MNKETEPGGSREHTVIWARPERAAKGPAPSRSRAQIAAAAVQLADAEGLEAVSMRKVAALLGIGAASLYRYIESKDELYELMVDHVEGEDGPPPPITGDWRADLSTFAHKARGFDPSPPVDGQPRRGAAHLRAELLRLERVRPRRDRRSRPQYRRDAHGRRNPSGLRPWLRHRRVGRTTGAPTSRPDLDQWMDALGPYMMSVVDQGKHPLLARVIMDADTPHAQDRDDLVFAAGLERILDGIVPQRAGQ